MSAYKMRENFSLLLSLEFVILFGGTWTFLPIAFMAMPNRFGCKSSEHIIYKLEKVT